MIDANDKTTANVIVNFKLSNISENSFAIAAEPIKSVTSITTAPICEGKENDGIRDNNNPSKSNNPIVNIQRVIINMLNFIYEKSIDS